MKAKNVKQDEKYILRGKKEDWCFKDSSGNKISPETKRLFVEGQKVVADDVHSCIKNGNINVKGGEYQYMLIHSKFLKKIKDKT